MREGEKKKTLPFSENLLVVSYFGLQCQGNKARDAVVMTPDSLLLSSTLSDERVIFNRVK